MIQKIMQTIKKNQFFWDALGSVSAYAPLSLFQKLPDQITIELTNACNLRCPCCPTHFAMKRERGYLDVDVFKKLVDEFKDVKIKPAFAMNFAGEPLLHQRVDEIIAYASKNGHRTFISSNTTLLKKSLSERLIRAGLSEIHVCLEGMTKEAHEAYRRGSNYEVVKQNIIDLLDAKRALNSNTPKVTIQTLLTRSSENDIEAMTEWARSIGADAINFKSFSTGSYVTEDMKAEVEAFLPTKPELLRKSTSVRRTVCTWPINNAIIFWNGDIGLCCIDFDQNVKMKNIKDDGFIKTYLSPELVAMRKLGFRKKFGICRNCTLGNADFMGWEVKLK
jgi:MoaA/NifB/PqqE/SkfB family radical SAM enzyme